MNEASEASVAIILGSASRRAGGLFHSVRELAIHLLALRCSVEVHALHDEFTAADNTAWLPIVPFTYAAFPPRSLGYSRGLRKAIAKLSTAVVQQHGIWQLFSHDVCVKRRRTGVPVIISPHGMLDPWALQNAAWKKCAAMSVYEQRNLRTATCFRALNTSEAVSIEALKLGVPIAIIPNGVTLPENGRHNLSVHVQMRDDRKVLLFLGRIHPKKGCTETIQAWARVLREKPKIGRQWTLAIAGWDDGGHLGKCKAAAAALGLERHVHFPGPLFGGDKDAALLNASAFILASYSEGLPMAVLEAWANHVPVFMTKACNLPEGFTMGAAIEISTEPSEIAKTLLEHLDDPLLSQLGLAGRQLVESRFTWNQIAHSFLQLHEWSCFGGATPTFVQTP